MEVFDIDSVPPARVKSFCILMCLKKTFPPSCGTLTSLCEDLEEDPGRVVSGGPSGRSREDLGSSRSLWVSAGISLIALKPSLGGGLPEASLLLHCPALG